VKEDGKLWKDREREIYWLELEVVEAKDGGYFGG